MEKKIDLEEILNRHLILSSMIPARKSFYVSAMKEACRQTLELAAENAKVTVSSLENLNLIVDKQSIINTIKQID